MGFIRQLLWNPQRLWLRRANFQIHLWSGIVLTLYIILIGFTGSILVFGSELGKMFNPGPWEGVNLPSRVADVSQVINTLRSSYPHTHVVSLMAPTLTKPVFIAILQSRTQITVACSAETGSLLQTIPRISSPLDWVYDLHENLFARRTGRVVNGCCAASLLLLIVTGMVNWWRGIRNWPRALQVDFRRNWRRVNFDLHSAIGFWSSGFLTLWAVTGIYFTWPQACMLLINRISPIVTARPPAISVKPQNEIKTLNFQAMLMAAKIQDPGTQWKGIIFPSSRRSPFQFLMSRSPGLGRDSEDTVFLNPYNGDYISTWHYGINESLGDWIIWLQIPLHFGTHWGLAVKCLWSAFGMALPTLAVTGMVMYWNRVLRKQWQNIETAQPRNA